MSDAKSEPIIWICSWSKCRKISRAKSKNGYCQKCYEGTQIPFIQAAEHQALQSELEAAKAEIERLREYENLHRALFDSNLQCTQEIEILRRGLEESDCTCGSEGDSDYSYRDGGCIKHQTLAKADKLKGDANE